VAGPSANEQNLGTRAGYAPGSSPPHVESNQTEKELTMEHDSINPDWRNAISRRIVEVTDEDENIIPEFIDLSPLNERGPI
jgi:hypothetical protein